MHLDLFLSTDVRFQNRDVFAIGIPRISITERSLLTLLRRLMLTDEVTRAATTVTR